MLRAPLLAAALLGSAASAQIQWGTIVSGSYLSSVTLWDPIVRRSAGGGGTAPTALTRPAQAPPGLLFRYDAGISRRVQAQLLAGARRTGSPQDVAALEEALISGQMRRAYEALMRSLEVDHGRSEDALDPLALSLMVTWAIANNTDLTPTPAMFQALRAQVGRAYAGMPEVLDTGAKRQEFGETLIYQAVLLASLHEALLGMEAGERQGVAHQIQQAALTTLGFDLRQLVLTEQGFGQRK